MSLDRNIRPHSVIRPRLLPYLACGIVLAVPVIGLLALRRDLVIELGLPLWLALSSAAAAALSVIAWRLVRPVPLMCISAGGIELPRLIDGILRWSDIQRVEATTRRGRAGDIHDRVLIHLRRPSAFNWRPHQLRRTLGGMPQAAIAVEIGLRWPHRADAIKDIIRKAARNFAEAPALRSDASAGPSPHTRLMTALALAAACLPVLAHVTDIGLPRLFSQGLALYRAGEVGAAVPFLEQDARSGDTVAAYALGTLYLNGDGVGRNPAMAAAWFGRAAEAGHADAQTRLGDAYRLGIGVPTDIDAALGWYRKASDGGSAAAAFTLARLYRLGDGVRRDYDRALKWLNIAAAREFAPAEHDLGQLYHEGIAVPRDLQAAADWYIRAARRGDMPAYYDLARLLLDGDDAARAKGLGYLSAAAEAGYAPAQRRLAAALFNGLGVHQDSIAAYKWIALAERSWPAATRADLVREKARIEAALSPEQINQATALIRNWRPVRP